MVAEETAEILVVGGGPAGSALALRLARAGRDVLVLEKSRFPREKACGDCVNPGAVAELRRLGVADRLAAKLTPRLLRGWRVEAAEGASFIGRYSSERGDESGRGGIAGWAVRRRDFDAALLREAEAAGARVRFGHRVFALLERDGRVAGVLAREGSEVREIRAGFVVGADGLRSVVRARLGLAARAPRLRKIALVAHLAREDDEAPFGELRLRGGRCCGYAPLPGGGNVTLVVPQEEVSEAFGDAEAFFADGVAAFPAVCQRLERCGLDGRPLVIGPFDQPVRKPWAPGVLLIGDAAGYYDPFTGQGIFQALRTADLAAAAIETILVAGELETRALRRYGRRVRSELAPTRTVQRMIEAAISRPQVASRFVRALAAPSGAAAQRLLRVTGDLAHPLTLADPLLWVRFAYRFARAR